MNIVIHGGGYVGVIGAVHFAKAGVNVTIYDPDQKTVDGINSGNPRTGEYLGYIDRDVASLVENKLLKATTDFESILSCPIHLLAVPTEKGDSPCMEIVKRCIIKLHDSIPDGGIIIVESTLQPGTIDQLYIPRVVNGGIFLAVAPRLDWFADSNKNVTNLPRIIGGYNVQSTVIAADILSEICKDIHETNYRVAEFAKAGQNHLYFVQIMAAYEMATKFQGNVDMNEALKFIGLHWRLPELYLGTGVSGRCIQMGTQYIVNAAIDKNRYAYFPIADPALRQNEQWRDNIATRLVKDRPFADQSAKILVMGIAYRPNFSDFGYSSGLAIAKILQEGAWNVEVHDSIVSRETLLKLNIPLGVINKNTDVILLATGHSNYEFIPEFFFEWKKGLFILDACGLWEKYRTLFKNKGVKYIRVGEENWMEK